MSLRLPHISVFERVIQHIAVTVVVLAVLRGLNIGVAISDGVDIAQRIRVQVTQFIRLLDVVLQGTHLHRHFYTVDVNCVMAGYHSPK